MIVKEKGTYSVKSEEGKNLGSGYTKTRAKRRVKQVEYFKYLRAKGYLR
jgi:hypothetical protein